MPQQHTAPEGAICIHPANMSPSCASAVHTAPGDARSTASLQRANNIAVVPPTKKKLPRFLRVGVEIKVACSTWSIATPTERVAFGYPERLMNHPMLNRFGVATGRWWLIDIAVGRIYVVRSLDRRKSGFSHSVPSLFGCKINGTLLR